MAISTIPNTARQISGTKASIGIVADGSTATQNITAGQYVIWKGALYTASTNIATGATLSISNLTAVPGGGLNALNGKLTRITYSKLGSPTNLSGGSSFLCASDGYLYVYCANNGTSCTINYSDGTVSATLLSAAYNGSPDERTVYVRKGMNFTIINTNSTVRFYPFVE